MIRFGGQHASEESKHVVIDHQANRTSGENVLRLGLKGDHSALGQGDAAFQTAVRAAFDEWASVANLEFVESDDTSGVDVRIGFGDLDGARGVLATTDYFYSGTMLKESFIRFDTAESWQSSLTSNGQTPTYLVALHEIGHALGLGHSTTGTDTVMKATLNRAAEGLGADDIEGIQKLYGAVAERQAETGSAPDALGGTGCGCGCGD